MTATARLNALYPRAGVRIFGPDRSITTTVSPNTAEISGFELAERIELAIRHREDLEKCITEMSALLDSGETLEERTARIAAEDADPKAAAQKYGWWAIEDFHAELLKYPSEGNFAPRIKNCKGQIVKPNHEILWYTGTWGKYPERHEYWADHFSHADSWEEALKKGRDEEKRKLRECK